MATPTEADIHGPAAADIETHLEVGGAERPGAGTALLAGTGHLHLRLLEPPALYDAASSRQGPSKLIASTSTTAAGQGSADGRLPAYPSYFLKPPSSLAVTEDSLVRPARP
jgi:hypothetical protein